MVRLLYVGVLLSLSSYWSTARLFGPEIILTQPGQATGIATMTINHLYNALRLIRERWASRSRAKNRLIRALDQKRLRHGHVYRQHLPVREVIG